MEHGDFTELAAHYSHRTGYSKTVLRMLATKAGAFEKKGFRVADVGAGTGKLTENLVELELPIVAVEPNDAMREEGMAYVKGGEVEWRKGSGEETGLDNASADWLLMASSFHWVDFERGLAEFHRVLRPGGHFTCLWNPRNLGASKLHMRIEERIHSIAPNIERKSSGARKYTEDMLDRLSSTGQFEDVIFVEGKHDAVMSKERYMGAWHSTNDIQVQAGPDKWQEILRAIEDEIRDLDQVVVPYKTRSWTCRRV